MHPANQPNGRLSNTPTTTLDPPQARRPFVNALVSSPAAADDLVAWHSLLEYPALLDLPNKRLLLQSELRLAHAPPAGGGGTGSGSNSGGAAGGGAATVEVARGEGLLQRLCDDYT